MVAEAAVGGRVLLTIVPCPMSIDSFDASPRVSIEMAFLSNSVLLARRDPQVRRVAVA